MLVRVVHGIVCSRIILNLRQAAAPGDALPTLSTGLIFAASPWQQTNPPHTVLLDTQDENEPFQRQTEEDFAVGQSMDL